MKRNQPTFAGLTKEQAIEFKKLSYAIFGETPADKVLTEQEEDSKECQRYFVLLNIRMGYLRSLHTTQATTFLPQSNNLVSC